MKCSKVSQCHTVRAEKGFNSKNSVIKVLSIKTHSMLGNKYTDYFKVIATMVLNLMQ